jgi:hypothetical protein
MIQDISIFYEKCSDLCTSNDCPSSGTYYKHRTLAKCVSDCNPDFADSTMNSCVSDCPNGYT